MFILTKIAEQFEFDREYTGKEVDVILKEIFDDYVSLRRSLIEYGFFNRTADGSNVLETSMIVTLFSGRPKSMIQYCRDSLRMIAKKAGI